MYKQRTILACIISMVIGLPFQVASHVLLGASLIVKLPAELASRIAMAVINEQMRRENKQCEEKREEDL